MTNFQTDTSAKVSGPAFIGFVWGATSISFLFIATRTIARLAAFRRLWLDDAFAIGAWLILLAQAITWQTQLNSMYYIFALEDGLAEPTVEVMARLSRLARAECAILILFYTCLWSIKASFLIFFRRIAGTDRSWIIWFWCVVGLVAGTYFVCLGDIEYNCLVNNEAYILEHCTQKAAVQFEFRTLVTNLVLDVVTDLCIISLPITLLWNVRIPVRRKAILMAILSVAVVIIIVAVVRVAVVARRNQNSDISWLWMWSFIEATVANIVACMASFRQLFMKQDQHSRGASYPAYPQSTPTGKRPGFHRVRTPSSRGSSDVQLHQYDSGRALTETA
ncbi:hypothetical protein BO86DRAFT_440362 [Aspergillus japonicus CBS 114.51]|uniref:Rhodopsin domain-containing protein n=2 Tax=Aspergillus TaxID=5052 RepID=A0A2V5HPS4_ASPV1|nr:hypothetical protein BO86DRAFT_440362 [Aspergillus japonicus CBS 114.51]PYI23593.1 hypothetical protein BO99DRAFT_439844 [Aspergillus violaceofuscus CBS 115571]RAH84985.1 hypothetical protein BO86DRAFT_440362 [Aspergillus japonicus CBS 114.51]